MASQNPHTHPHTHTPTHTHTHTHTWPHLTWVADGLAAAAQGKVICSCCRTHHKGRMARGGRCVFHSNIAIGKGEANRWWERRWERRRGEEEGRVLVRVRVRERCSQEHWQRQIHTNTQAHTYTHTSTHTHTQIDSMNRPFLLPTSSLPPPGDQTNRRLHSRCLSMDPGTGPMSRRHSRCTAHLLMCARVRVCAWEEE